MKFRVRQVAVRVKVIVSVLKTNLSQCVGLISDGYTACERERERHLKDMDGCFRQNVVTGENCLI